MLSLVKQDQFERKLAFSSQKCCTTQKEKSSKAQKVALNICCLNQAFLTVHKQSTVFGKLILFVQPLSSVIFIFSLKESFQLCLCSFLKVFFLIKRKQCNQNLRMFVSNFSPSNVGCPGIHSGLFNLGFFQITAYHRLSTNVTALKSSVQPLSLCPT